MENLDSSDYWINDFRSLTLSDTANVLTEIEKSMRCALCFVIVLFIGWVIRVDAQDKIDQDFHLYIFMGQSNMAGRGKMTDEFRSEGHARVLMLNKEGQWVVARHPLHFDKPAIAAVGPGLAFGISVAKTDSSIRVGLIPCAVGGTSIKHWRPGAYDVRTKTHPYDDALIRIRQAMRWGVIKGVLWHQGESDKRADKAAGYAAELTVLIEAIRKEVGDPELPFVMGELARFAPDHDNINRELVKVAAQVPLTGVVSSEGLIHNGDQVHFDSSSARILGKRFAERMLKF
jgi:hypothetical protein